MQDTITIQFSNKDKLIVKTSLFDNYPSCPIRKMIEDFGSIPSDYVISFDLMSLKDFVEIREVLRGKKSERTLSLKLRNKADHYGLTNDTCFAERHLLAEKMETKINKLEGFESGVGCPLLVVSEQKYNRLKTKFEGKKNIVPCCVLSISEYNDQNNNNFTELRAIVIYDKILISQGIVTEKTGKVDVNEMKHEVMFAWTLRGLRDYGIRYDLVKKYKDVPVAIDSEDVSFVDGYGDGKAKSHQVIYESWFHKKSLGNLFSSNAKRILRGVSDMMRDQEILECDSEADVGNPIYYKQYSDYSSQLEENTFELEVKPKDVNRLIRKNYEVINQNVMKRIKALSCVYLYHLSDDDDGRRLDTTSYYTTFCFVRV